MDADFKSWLEGMISEALDEYKDYPRDVYGSDLAYTLFEGENINGSVTCSSYEAREFIKEHWDAAGDFHEYMKDSFGEVLQNPFDNPEAFQVGMLLEGAQQLLSQCHFIKENWNDEIELNACTIAFIKDDLSLDTNDVWEGEIDQLRELYEIDSDLADGVVNQAQNYSIREMLADKLDAYGLDEDDLKNAMDILKNVEGDDAPPSLADEARDARAGSDVLERDSISDPSRGGDER